MDLLPDYSHRTAVIFACIALILGTSLLMILLREDGPRFRPVPIMTNNEMEFYRRLTEAMPDVHFFPQVAMSALIAPNEPDGKKRMAAFRKISQKRVDWAVFNQDMKLLCIVELDDRTHDAEKDAIRDKMLDTAGIITVRWDSRRKPSVAAIRKELSAIAAQAA